MDISLVSERYFRQKYKYFFAFGLVLGIFLAFSFCQAKGNEPAIPDSLQNMVTQAKSDTARLRAMSEIVIWMTSYRTDLITNYLENFKEEAEKANSPIWIGKAYNFYGVYYGRLPDYDKALKAYFQAISIFDKIDNKMGVAAASHNVAIILDLTKDHKKALFYYRKAISMNTQLKNKAWLLKNYNAISSVFNTLKQSDSCLFYLEKSLSLSNELHSKKGMMYANGNLGNFYTEKEDYKKSEFYTRIAYDLSAELKEDLSHAEYAMDLGNDYIHTNRLAEAETFLQEALAHYQKIKFKKHFEVCYFRLSKLEEKKGNFAQSLLYYKKFHEISDSLLTEGKNKSIREYEIKYESEKKEQENILLRKDNTIKRLQLFGMGFIALLLVLFVAYFYYVNVQMKTKNALISRQKEDLLAKNQTLNALLNEKDNIIATVSHDYRSPLGRIRAIIDLVLLQKENFSQKQLKHLQKIPVILAEATHLIDDLLDVTYIERLKEELQPEIFEMKAGLFEVVEDYEHWITQKNLKIVYNLPQEDCPINTDKQAFKRIFDNLISNAVKYSPLDKTIFLTITRKEENYTIIVEDEGQGFSKEDKLLIFSRFQRLSAQPIAVGTSYGLGLSIVKTLVEGLGATICLQETEIGASFCVEIKAS